MGLGIGLPTAALLASRAPYMEWMNKETVDTINRGEIVIQEPDLDAYVRSAKNNKLKAFLAVQPADIYIICVPTPFHDDIETPTPT